MGKVSVFSDDVEEIAHEVEQFSPKYPVDIITGGIGPPNDDITMHSIA